MYAFKLTTRHSIAIYILSFAMGLFLYFACNDCYKGDSLGAEQYAGFSKHIYEPNTAFYAESILQPFLASLLGANKTREAYNTLSAFATIAIIPLLACGLMSRLHKWTQVLFVLFVYAFSFAYLRSFWLGYPDPIVLILLNFAALSIRPVHIFLLVYFAAMAHFSLTVAASVSLIAMYYACGSVSRSNRPKMAMATLGALVFSKLSLLLWYYVFSYRLHDRIDFVANRSLAGLLDGVMSFYSSYLQSPVDFWMTPQISFLACCILMVLYFAIQKRFKVCLALAFSISVAYAVRFITTDGLRDFATTISGAYVIALFELARIFQCPRFLKSR